MVHLRIHFTLEAEEDPQQNDPQLEDSEDDECAEHLEFDLDISEEVGDYSDEGPDPAGSGLPACYNLVTQHRSVRVFAVKGNDEYCIKIMQDFHHPNILRLESLIYNTEENAEHTLLVEPYEGDLQSYFEDMIMDLPTKLPDIVLSAQSVFRQVLDGVVFLMDNDLNHGKFSLENTYYYKKKHEAVIKLANFEEWTMDEEGWNFDSDKRFSDDWFCVGKSLDAIVGMLINHRGEIARPYTSEMRELALLLKDRKINAAEKKKLAYEQTFFWTPAKRASVFTYNIGTLLKDKSFYNMVNEKLKVPANFVWNDDKSHCGLLYQMNDHKSKKSESKKSKSKKSKSKKSKSKKSNSKYTGEKRAHYLKFVSGSYTHENVFKKKLAKLRSVDEIFRTANPELCVDVMTVVKAFKAQKAKTG